MAPTIPGVEIFSQKSACVVFFYMQNWNFGGASETETTELALVQILFRGSVYITHGEIRYLTKKPLFSGILASAVIWLFRGEWEGVAQKD